MGMDVRDKEKERRDGGGGGGGGAGETGPFFLQTSSVLPNSNKFLVQMGIRAFSTTITVHGRLVLRP